MRTISAIAKRLIETTAGDAVSSAHPESTYAADHSTTEIPIAESGSQRWDTGSQSRGPLVGRAQVAPARRQAA
ncbi:hypothetical protein GCM10009777_38930 [Microbacterium pumilum]|uniref:Uncharacterized protein n=1 Tax=Microbacterium pumilum TaxID=344165 RepID=A0ABN2T482_9MICO